MSRVASLLMKAVKMLTSWVVVRAMKLLILMKAPDAVS